VTLILRSAFRFSRESRARCGGAAAVALAMLAACSTSGSSASATLTPPHLSIVGFRAAGSPESTPGSDACVAVGTDPDGTVVVVLKVNKDSGGLLSWTFESPSPASCSGTPQCGFVALTICSAPVPGDPAPADCADNPTSREFISAGTTVSIPVASLPVPLGAHHLHVELRNSDGSAPASGSALKAFVTDANVDFCPSPVATDAGTAPDATTTDAGAHLDGGSDATPALPDASIGDASPGRDGGDAATILDAGRDAASAPLDANRAD
jgi:hypothetical protein